MLKFFGLVFVQFVINVFVVLSCKQIDYVGTLLESLPRESSVVLTSAEKILVELFTHHGKENI